jgi:hypothetical protein
MADEYKSIADTGINAASVLGPGGGSMLALPYVGGGITMPSAVALDGNGTAWVANNQAAGSISPLRYVQIGLASPANGLAA